jgi:ankyrin repeat protein
MRGSDEQISAGGRSGGALDGEARVDPDSRNNEGWTFLICAAAANQPEIVKLLLDHHADIEARDPRNRTALHWAASCHSLDSAKLLVAAGADLEATDDEGETPLLISVSSGARVPRFLMAQSANVHAKNRHGADIFELSQNYANELHPLILRLGGRRE